MLCSFEYSINDAYLPYQLSIQDSKDNLNFIIDDYLAFNSDIEIVLMTMNNPAGGHLTSRPNVAAYYQAYRDVAAERNLLLIDHYPNWLNLYNTDPATWDTYLYDGLHPNPLGAEKVIVPEIIRALEAASQPVPDKEFPVIAWNNPAAITFGAVFDSAQLNATANVAGTFSYAPASGAVLNAGTHTLTANFTPTDAVRYASASKAVSITVNKATFTITWNAPSAITYGTALRGIRIITNQYDCVDQFKLK
jgi:hypothetical protein